MTAHRLAQIVVRIARDYDSKTAAEVDIGYLLELWREKNENIK